MLRDLVLLECVRFRPVVAEAAAIQFGGSLDPEAGQGVAPRGVGSVAVKVVGFVAMGRLVVSVGAVSGCVGGVLMPRWSVSPWR